MTFLIDTDVLIRAKNDYYGFDFCPGFWDWLRHAHGQGIVFAPIAVRDEILRGKDELALWLEKFPESFFIEISARTQPHLTAVSEWANQWKDRANTPKERIAAESAVGDFFRAADYFLVSQARELGYTVVTNEVSASTSKGRIKIPDVCSAVGVRSMNTYSMLRTAGVKLTFAP